MVQRQWQSFHINNDDNIDDGLLRLAHCLSVETPLRVEIRGTSRITIISSSQKVDFTFSTFRIPEQALNLLVTAPILPKVLLAELYNEPLLQILHALTRSHVSTLEIANCALDPQDPYLILKSHPLSFPTLETLNVYSSHLTESQLNALLQSAAPRLQHFSIYLVAGARSINGVFEHVTLPCLTSIDFRGRFCSEQRPCFNGCPRLSHVVIVETLGSRVYLGDLVHGGLQELLLGKTIATRRDWQRFASALRQRDCRMRRVHLFAVDVQDDVVSDTTTVMDDLMEAIRENKSLVEIVIGTEEFRTKHQEELRLLMMRNKYIAQGLGRIPGIRFLPHYLSSTTQTQSFSLFGKVTRDQVEAIYFMVKERPDLFCIRH